MADLNQLVAALQQADAAGDTQAATAIAAAIKQARDAAAPRDSQLVSGLKQNLGEVNARLEQPPVADPARGRNEQVVARQRRALEARQQGLQEQIDNGGSTAGQVFARSAADALTFGGNSMNKDILQGGAQEHPVAATAGAITGSIPSIVATAPLAGAAGVRTAAALPRLGSIARAAGEGATYGGVLGAGHGLVGGESDTVGGRLLEGATGALKEGAIGAVTGGALQGLGTTLRRGGAALRNRGNFTTQETLAQEVGKRIGVPAASRIDDELINAADDVYKPMFDDAARGNTVSVPSGFAAEVNTLKQSLSPQSRWAATRLLREAPEGAPLPADKWLKIRSEISAQSRGGTAPGDANILRQVVDKMDDVLESSSSLSGEQLANLSRAREIYRNLQPVEDMVRNASNTGEITASQFRTAIKKAGGTDSYARGNAPLQDLQTLADRLLDNKSTFTNQLKNQSANTNTALAALASEFVLPTGMGAIPLAVRGGQIVLNSPAGRQATAAVGRGAQRTGAIATPERSALVAALVRRGTERDKKSK